MQAKAIVFILFIALLGCQKGDNPNITLNGALTNCSSNSTCTYNYYDNANFANGLPAQGNYRAFWYNSISATVRGATSQFYFKTPMGVNDFDISSSQIAASQVVAYNFACPCCYIGNNAEIPIGGEIKGKRTDADHWLINATIILGVSVNHAVDTLIVNQYFSLEKIP
jgi:hypothetical protein